MSAVMGHPYVIVGLVIAVLGTLVGIPLARRERRQRNARGASVDQGARDPRP